MHRRPITPQKFALSVSLTKLSALAQSSSGPIIFYQLHWLRRHSMLLILYAHPSFSPSFVVHWQTIATHARKYHDPPSAPLIFSCYSKMRASSCSLSFVMMLTVGGRSSGARKLQAVARRSYSRLNYHPCQPLDSL